jgi:hypothetical protein
MHIEHIELGVCGLSCRLCPMHNTQVESRCAGCKSPDRMAVGCPFITCAVKKKGLEFCWQCQESTKCEKWRKHREAGKQHDSFKSYQKLEDDIAFIQEHGIDAFEEQQKVREHLLKEMLLEFNDGRSKSYYCIAATVLDVDELQAALTKAKAQTSGMTQKEKTKILHSVLDQIADEKGYLLKLRK